MGPWDDLSSGDLGLSQPHMRHHRAPGKLSQNLHLGSRARPAILVSDKKHPLCASPCPAVQQQKPLSRPRFVALKASIPTFQLRIFVPEECFSQTGITLTHSCSAGGPPEPCPVSFLRRTKGVPRKGVQTSVSMRVRTCKEVRVKHDPTSCNLRPPFLGTP